MKVNPDDYFGSTATADAPEPAPAPKKRSTNPDDYFGKVPEPPPPPEKGALDKAVEAITEPAADPNQRPAGERRGGTAREAGKAYGAGDKRVEPPTGNVLDKPPKDQPPGQPLIEKRGAPINEETASAIKRGVGAMPTSEPARPFTPEALQSAKDTLGKMAPEQRANQLARTDLPKWMRSAMRAAAREVDNDERLNQTMGRLQTQGDQQERERDRTAGEFGRDILLSGLEGIGTINQIVANVVDPGSQWGKDTAATIQAIRADQSVQKQYQDMQRAGRVKDAGGEGAQFAQQLWELLISPTAAVEEIARQGPLMAAMIGTTLLGGGVGGAAVGLAGRAVPAVAIADVISGGAITAAGSAAGTLVAGRAAGAVAAAGDAGSQVFQQLTDKQKTPDAVLLDNQDFKRIFQENLAKGMDGRQALDAARTSIAVTRSRLAQAIAAPLGAVSGGIGLEKVLAYGLKGVGKREAAKELTGETVEEVGTQMASNAAGGTVDPSQRLMEGTGQVAATSLVTSAPLAALTGYLARTPPTEVLAPTQAKAEAIKRFDELAAAFGLSPAAVKAVKGRIADKPADDVPGYLARAADALNKRGLFGKPVTDEGVRQLDQSLSGATAPPEAPATPTAGSSSTPTGSPTAQTAPGQGPADPRQTPGQAQAAPEVETVSTPLDAGSLLGTPVDEQAHAAATSPTNDRPEPTPAQKEAGNYKVGRIKLGGLDISIENPQGSVRKGVDEDGKAWENTLQHHYGYVRGTVGADGDHVDAFIKPGTAEDYSGPVFVIDQRDPKTGKFDEHKIMLGFSDPAEAEAAYRSNYAPDWQGLGYLTGLDMPAFKAWVNGGNHKAPFSAGFKEGKGDNQRNVAVPPPVAAPAPAGGGAVPGGSGGNLGSQPAGDGRVGGVAPAPEPGSGAPAPVGAVGVTNETLSDAPDFQATFPRPVPNQDGRGSAFEGLEDDPEFLANAVRGVHQEVGFGIQANAGTAKVLRDAIGKNVDPATGQAPTPERAAEMQQELAGALDGIDGLLDDYEGEFGPTHRQAFQAAVVPELEDLRAPVKPPAAAPAPAAPAAAPAPQTEAQKKRAENIRKLAAIMGQPVPEAPAPAGAPSPEPAAPAPKLDTESKGVNLPGMFGKTYRQVVDSIIAKHGRRAWVDGNSLMFPGDVAGSSNGVGNLPPDVVAYAQQVLNPAHAPADGSTSGGNLSTSAGRAQNPAESAQVAPSWAGSEFAPRIEKALADMEALGEKGVEMARVTRLGLDSAVKAGKLDEARAAFTEDLARKTAGRLNREATTWEPMTLAQLRDEDGTVGTLPEPIQQAALDRLNVLGPYLALQGAKNWKEATADWPREAQDLARQMRDVLQALMHLAPARYQEAKGHKNRNPDKLGRMEDNASQVLGIDTRAHPGVDTTNQITAGGVLTRKAKAKNVSLYPKTVGGSELLGFINRLGGISYGLLHDLSFKKPTGLKDKNGRAVTAWYNPSGGRNVGEKGRPGGHGLFREGGLETDDLTEALEEGGFLAPGSIEADYKAAEEEVRAAITAALNKDEPEGVVDIETRLERERDEAFYAHQAQQDSEKNEELRLFLMGEVGISEFDMDAGPDAALLADNPVWDHPEDITVSDLLFSFGWSDSEVGDYLQLHQRIDDARQEDSDEEGTAGAPGREAGVDGPSQARAAAAPGASPPGPADRQDQAQAVDRGEVDAAIARLTPAQVDAVAALVGIDADRDTPMKRTLLLMRDLVQVRDAIDQVLLDDFSLEAPSLDDLQAAAARGDAARAAEIAEQRRLAGVEGARKRALEKQRADAEADKIRKERADAAVDDFQLGQEPPSAKVTTSDIVGQKDVFADTPDEPAVSHLPPTRDETLIELRKRVAVLTALRKCLG